MKPKILFMGTPDFSIPALDLLVKNGYPVIGAVTQPEKPKGRGKKRAPTAVKLYAEAAGIPVYEPERVRSESFLETFRMLAPDMVVLVAFGQILPSEIINSPPLGCINLHPSLLPHLRGAAPIHWAIIRGEKKTGVTIIKMDEGVDSGDILLQEETEIDPLESFGELSVRLAAIGARMLIKSVGQVVDGIARPISQDSSAATYAPRLSQEMGHIDWRQSSKEIVNLIRGLSPSPGAFTFLRDKKLKIYQALAGDQEASGEKEPGRVGRLFESGLQVMAGDGHVYLREIQLEGRKRMSVADFLRGNAISSEDVLE
ncbi:MAG: methionyl-tRNA formyltransferase [Syntrophales bacterium]|jgi:methionyl-tRNA formyltransferase|nr:methionyl-tRNA formyltransferase [Syntrophales bacterium]MDY0045068.1 methionyl-tRNA formyltransferase [Syntrophales bacterium]